MQIFGLPQETITSKVTCISDYKEASFEEVYYAFEKSFLDGQDFFEQELQSGEWKLVHKLLYEKYKREEWNMKFEKREKGS